MTILVFFFGVVYSGAAISLQFDDVETCEAARAALIGEYYPDYEPGNPRYGNVERSRCIDVEADAR